MAGTNVDKFTHYRVDPDGQWWFHDNRAVYKSILAGFTALALTLILGNPF